MSHPNRVSYPNHVSYPSDSRAAAQPLGTLYRGVRGPFLPPGLDVMIGTSLEPYFRILVYMLIYDFG